ncbi:MAG: hypothetical protein IPK78_03855 [Rhodospirillales bacterium]|nr:hypothetical protein [Rhodospirillales bacterium]
MDGTTFKVRDRSYEQVWSAAVRTVSSLGSIETKNRDNGEIRGFRAGSGTWDCGNALGVFIDPHSDGRREFAVAVVGTQFDFLQLTGTDLTMQMKSTMLAFLSPPRRHGPRQPR